MHMYTSCSMAYRTPYGTPYTVIYTTSVHHTPPYTQFALALEVFQHWWDLYVVRVPRVLRGGWPAVRSTMHDRMWQFWLKTWVIFSTVVCSRGCMYKGM